MHNTLILFIFAVMVTACSGAVPTNLGPKADKLAECPATPNCVSSFSLEETHKIEPLLFKDSPAEALARLEKILKARGDVTIIASDPKYIRVEFRTFLGFVDDGEFMLSEKGGRIDVRSASRVGKSDLGKNRKRIEEIRAAFAL